MPLVRHRDHRHPYGTGRHSWKSQLFSHRRRGVIL